MKKMMMAVAVICSAVAVQAASVSWTSNNKQFCDATGTPVTSMIGGELVLVTLGASIDWSAATEITTAASGLNTTTLVLNQGTGNKTGRVTGQVNFTYTGSGSDFINNGDYLALMWKDATTGDLSKLVYTADGSEVEAVVQVSGLANNATALTGKAINFTGNFAAVPEPTSGLLLLLGMAGLALRRKQS
jgi:hypothetical protein